VRQNSAGGVPARFAYSRDPLDFGVFSFTPLIHD
jgi:hypothetical protein